MLEVAFTLYEASRATGVPASTLQHFIRNGELPTTKIGRSRVIRRSSLDEFLATHEVRGLDEGDERIDTGVVGQVMAEARS